MIKKKNLFKKKIKKKNSFFLKKNFKKKNFYHIHTRKQIYVLHTVDYCITFSLTSTYFSSKIVSFRTSGVDKDS